MPNAPPYPEIEERSVEWLTDEYHMLSEELRLNGRTDTNHLWKMLLVEMELEARGIDTMEIAREVQRDVWKD